MGEYFPRGESVFSVNNSTKELSDAGIDPAILSGGATEQCGPNLPLNIDTLVADYYARAWGEILQVVVTLSSYDERSIHRGFIAGRL